MEFIRALLCVYVVSNKRTSQCLKGSQLYIAMVDTKALVSFGLSRVMEKIFKSEMHLSSNESYRIYFMVSFWLIFTWRARKLGYKAHFKLVVL